MVRKKKNPEWNPLIIKIYIDINGILKKCVRGSLVYQAVQFNLLAMVLFTTEINIDKNVLLYGDVLFQNLLLEINLIDI